MEEPDVQDEVGNDFIGQWCVQFGCRRSEPAWELQNERRDPENTVPIIRHEFPWTSQ